MIPCQTRFSANRVSLNNSVYCYAILNGEGQGKSEFIFYQRNSPLSAFVHYANGSRNVLRLKMQWQHSAPNEQLAALTRTISRPQSRPKDYAELGNFMFLLARQRNTRFINHEHTELLFYLLKLFFGDILFSVVVVIVVSFSSLKKRVQTGNV